MNVELRRIGFIGLGIMGQPMAGNLVRAGYHVTGYNRSDGAVERLVAQGGHAAATVGDVVRAVDAVITMLPNSTEVEGVALGADGLFANARHDLLYVDMSTIHPAVARRLGEVGAREGIRVLDAPVSGGEIGAHDASLSIMVGGATPDVAAARDFLETLGKTVVHVGPSGAGQTVKAANQLIVAGTIELLAEAIVLLEASGVDPLPAIAVLAGGLAGSRVLDLKANGMLTRSFQPGFRVALHHKDLGIVQQAARESGAAIPLGSMVSQLMAALNAQGHGDLDHSALLKVVEQMSGRETDREGPRRDNAVRDPVTGSAT